MLNHEIVQSLIKTGIDAQQFTSKENSIIEATKENEELGYVGLPSKITTSSIEASIKSDKIPVPFVDKTSSTLPLRILSQVFYIR